MTKAQRFSFLSRGKSTSTRRTFAKQTPDVTNPNVLNLTTIDNVALQCEGSTQQKCVPIANSDVPGDKNEVICDNDDVPITRLNYKPTYSSG